MRWQQKLLYSFGHIHNDLCAAMWFTLLIVFFQYIIHFRDALAGCLLLWGQVVDAIATPIVGYLCDFTDGFCRLGKRKSWHLLGNAGFIISLSVTAPLAAFCLYHYHLAN